MPPDDAVIAARMRCLAGLAGPTAHEIRGAANALQIHLELLGSLDGDDAAARERRRQYLHVLREQSGRLRRVAEAFIGLAALPAGPAEIDLGALVGDVVEGTQPLATARRVRLAASPPPAVTRTVAEPEACRQRLLDVLLAVLADAPPGSAVHVVLAPDGRHSRVEVEGGACTDVPLFEPAECGDA